MRPDILPQGNPMRRILLDLKIMLLANLWIVPVLALLIGTVGMVIEKPYQ